MAPTQPSGSKCLYAGIVESMALYGDPPCVDAAIGPPADSVSEGLSDDLRISRSPVRW